MSDDKNVTSNENFILYNSAQNTSTILECSNQNTNTTINTEITKISRNDDPITDTKNISNTENIPEESSNDVTLICNEAVIIESMETEEVIAFPNYLLDTSKLFEITNVIYPSNTNQNYIRGCKWSPDGTCLLYAVRGQGMSLVELPTEIYTMKQMDRNRATSKLKPVVQIAENALLYDFNWFPGMNSRDPSTCCWITSCQHGPAQLWDAFTGELRCTYRGYDLVDEVEAALSVQFSVDGQKLYCGYRRALRVFDVNRPGRDSSYYKLSYPVTAVATNIAQPGQSALGSWHKVVQLIDDRSGTIVELTRFTGHFGGVTHLRFSPDGTCLYSGARKDNEIICWDLRSTGRPLFSLVRKSNTNQRIYFDLSPCGTFVFSGGTDGYIKTWSLLEQCELDDHTQFKERNIITHADCVNSVSVHPYLPVLATGSGQHHFFLNADDISSDDDDAGKHCSKDIENSIRIWWMAEYDES